MIKKQAKATQPKDYPEPPPGQVRCAVCGYTAPENEYRHFCWSAVFLLVVVFSIPLSGLAILIGRLINE